jgi:hypothetical protein
VLCVNSFSSPFFSTLLRVLGVSALDSSLPVSAPQRLKIPRFTAPPPSPTLTFVRQSSPFRWALLCSLLVCAAPPIHAQQPAAKVPEIPAQIELLETRVRFEANGDSRKEVHTRVRINNELGVRQFSRLTFDFNRSFQQIDIPSVHITHASGGTADILPSAISDQPSPAVASAPAYQDVRVKSLRILGLAPGDNLEYRVVTTTSHHPLAPDFWLSHYFSHDAIVTQELFEVSVPPSRKVKLYNAPSAPSSTIDESGDGPDPAVTYRWQRSSDSKPEHAPETSSLEPEVVLTTYESWRQLCHTKVVAFFGTMMVTPPEIAAKASALTKSATTDQAKVEAVYDFVSQKIKTVDLPLGATGFRTREAAEILSSGYATPEDKFVLFSALVNNVVGLAASAAFASTTQLKDTAEFARPAAFDHLLARINLPSYTRWLDLSLGIAPYGMIPSQLRGQRALLIYPPAPPTEDPWRDIPKNLPFAAMQKVYVTASLAEDGTLNAKVHYAMRGDNELLLRVAFHQSPRDKWKEVAQLLALSDGFRGKIISASASDPYATKQPFTIDYEITQPKFVDWSKKPVRIPALLPLLGLPDPPAKPGASATSAPIDLGTPLNVDTKLTLHLPPGVSAEGPTGTSVERDYATFTSHYAAEGNVVFASRHINFLLREVPAARAADYNAFLHAVQTDQSQLFTLDRAATLPASAPLPNQTASPNPKP